MPGFLGILGLTLEPSLLMNVTHNLAQLESCLICLTITICITNKINTEVSHFSIQHSVM